MGGCSSKAETPEAARTRRKSMAIRKQLEQDMRLQADKTTLLLLGAGESGKSTLFKQFQLMYGAPKTGQDLNMFAAVVRNNITILLKRLFPLVVSLDLEETFEPAERAAYKIILESISGQKSAAEQVEADAALPVTLQKEIQTLFRSKTWESVWAHRSTVNAIDAHKLFLDELDAIAAPDYVPTQQHIVNARIRTTHAVNMAFTLGGRQFELYDVGGQRSARKKWLPLFDGVTAVIFVAALSEYDQKLSEDPRMNRMNEALGLFTTIIAQEAFLNVPILLFLNKKDLFEEKLPLSRIQDQKEFSNYSGNNYGEATEYFEQKFRDCFETPKAEWGDRLFIHSTDATNSENVLFVWDTCKQIIMDKTIEESGF